jgi:hypothetical protein
MKEVIYYPGFELRSDDWLKFALLYIDHLDPIIPESGDKYLGTLSQKLQNETDLIIPHRPDKHEGSMATLDAIELVDQMLQSPKHYCTSLGEENFVSAWKDTKNHRFTLFQQKYSTERKHFCISNGLGQPCHEGIRVARSLGLIYMSFLAHIISESRGIPPITDHPRMDDISVVTRKATTLDTKKLNIAKSVLKLKIPANLKNISIDKIIEFRNETDFIRRLHAFHEELSLWISDVENGKAEGDFYQTRGNAFSEFSDEFVKLGAEISTFGLGIWLLLSDPATNASYIKEICAGAVLTIGSVIAIRNTWNHTQTKRNTRKYLAALEELS